MYNFPLTFEEYAYLLFPGKLEGDVYFYNIAKHRELKNKLENSIGKDKADIIHKMGMAISCSYSSKKDLFLNPEQNLDAIKYSFRMIMNITDDMFNGLIGHGYTSLVYAIDESRVKKVPYTNFSTAEERLYTQLESKFIPVFPKIYEYNPRYVIMERLVTNSPLLDKFKKYISKFIIHRFTEEVGYRDILNSSVIPLEFYDFIQEITTNLKQILDVNSIGDLTPSNIGIRPQTDEIVLFDPIDGLVARDYGKISLKHPDSDNTA